MENESRAKRADGVKQEKATKWVKEALKSNEKSGAVSAKGPKWAKDASIMMSLMTTKSAKLF